MTVKKKEEREREKKRGENSPSVLYLSRVLCYPQFMRTRIPTIFIARVAYYSPFFHPLLFLCIDIDLSYRLCFCRGDCRRDTYSLEYRRRMWASERASEREREQFGPVFISMVSSSIRIAYKSKSNPISKIMIQLIKILNISDVIKISRISELRKSYFLMNIYEKLFINLSSILMFYIYTYYHWIGKQRLINPTWIVF